jgi:hypothetical protein
MEGEGRQRAGAEDGRDVFGAAIDGCVLKIYTSNSMCFVKNSR